MTGSRRAAIVACLALAVVATTACVARRTPPIRYYTVQVRPADAARVPAGITISRIDAEPGYADTRMAWRPSPYRVEYSSFHRWVAPPPAMLASALEAYFRASPAADPVRRVYVSGTVRRMEAVREDGARAARLTLTLVAEVGGRAVLERTWDEREPLEDDAGAEAVAAALSRALERILEDFSAALAAALPAP